jgi:hypothetical protein
MLQAHEQLRAVLLTLLEELPSDLPILLLGSSSSPLAEIDGASLVFPHRSAYVLFLKAIVCCNPCTAFNHYDVTFLASNVALKFKFFTLNIILISYFIHPFLFFQSKIMLQICPNRKDYLTLLCLY